jgi:hypothetical protein
MEIYRHYKSTAASLFRGREISEERETKKNL